MEAPSPKCTDILDGIQSCAAASSYQWGTKYWYWHVFHLQCFLSESVKFSSSADVVILEVVGIVAITIVNRKYFK